METKYIKSPLNYTGGKYKLLKTIIPLFPKDINIFVDLFAGGCNVGINVDAKRIIFNDNLTYLIDLYKSFQTNGYDNVLKHIQNRISEYNLSLTNETGYNELRKLYNQTRNQLDLFVLLAYSFNHQIRFNNKHEFNTSFGKDRSSFNSNMQQNLEAFINKITNDNVLFTNNDFYSLSLNKLTSNDFVYCDPPYLLSIGSYNDGKRGFKGWTQKEEKELLALLTKLNDNGIRFALSNVLQHKGLSNELLIDFIDKNKLNVHYLDYNYSNCNYHQLNREKETTVEVLVTNY